MICNTKETKHLSGRFANNSFCEREREREREVDIQTHNEGLMIELSINIKSLVYRDHK